MGKRRLRARRPIQRRLRLVTAGVAIALVLLAVAIAARWLIDAEASPRKAEVATQDAFVEGSDPLSGATSDIPFPDLAPDRPFYRYSVIPGGAYDNVELAAAIQDDPVVAAHYAQLDQTRVRVETVTRDRLVHVSYRKGNQILWTKNKVLLRQGETILTDGTIEIRTRCGNCISEQPMLPTSDTEPDVVEFDRLTEPVATLPMAGSYMVLVPPSATGLGVNAPGSAADPGGLATPRGANSFSSGFFPLAESTRGFGGAGHLGPTPGPDADLPPLVSIPSLTGPGAPGDELFPGTHSFPLPGDPFPPFEDLVPPFDNPLPPFGDPLPPFGDPLPPETPVHAPEPGTLLLVGGGAVELIRRRWRARQRNSGISGSGVNRPD